MKIKIIDRDRFEKVNGIYGLEKIDLLKEYVVFAVEGKRKTELLIDMNNYLIWCKKDNSIEIIDDSYDENWIFTKKFKGGYVVNGYFQSIAYRDLYSPKWMVGDKEFFMDIIEQNSIAREKLKQNSTK